MAASVHEAEVRLNAAPTAIDPDDEDTRKTCLRDDDPRVEAIGELIWWISVGKSFESFVRWLAHGRGQAPFLRMYRYFV